MKRWPVLLFGVVNYGLFLAAFLYLAAFIGGFYVPTTLDGPLISSWTEARGRQHSAAGAVCSSAFCDGSTWIQKMAHATGPGSRQTKCLARSYASPCLFMVASPTSCETFVGSLARPDWARRTQNFHLSLSLAPQWVIAPVRTAQVDRNGMVRSGMR